ncbi:hypothetical protein VTN77DRAFT_3593 [Rasamsonia byssochlamydoides]|uniref:uncharacterized protein n=1 Tax=Rasamsonia byssochlamydoides TaxID=89139 RepID=UPI003742E709
MSQQAEKRRTVAVVGTGLAGLVTAYLLHHDPQQRYQVKLLEKKNEFSLSSESMSIPTSEPGKFTVADVPMRAFAGGFYHHLIRMYDYLGVRYHSQQFIFSFTRLSSRGSPSSGKLPSPQPHMVHASNFHRLPPVPGKIDLIFWLLEAAYALFFYVWFIICASYVAPYEASSFSSCETFGHYLRRICLPQYYITNYLLPLMSSVCTCSHQELLNFPASDVLDYKKRTHLQPHYAVDAGVQCVQEKLARGIEVNFGVCLTRVVPGPDGVRLTYVDAHDNEKSENFDLVVLAISPDIVAAVFEPLKDSLSRIPTTTVETVAHIDSSSVPALPVNYGPAQNIHFRFDKESTEAIHEQPHSSVIVTTNPITPIKRPHILRSARFTRVLRSPESRRIINEIFGDDKGTTPRWRNGDGGVYLAGGWCWDGMVLLEGCVVSAMRVASSLDVEIPWM